MFDDQINKWDPTDRQLFAGESPMSSCNVRDLSSPSLLVLPVKRWRFRGGEIPTHSSLGNSVRESHSLLVLPMRKCVAGLGTLRAGGLLTSLASFDLGSSSLTSVLFPRRLALRGGATIPGPNSFSSCRPCLVFLNW